MSASLKVLGEIVRSSSKERWKDDCVDRGGEGRLMRSDACEDSALAKASSAADSFLSARAFSSRLVRALSIAVESVVVMVMDETRLIRASCAVLSCSSSRLVEARAAACVSNCTLIVR